MPTVGEVSWSPYRARKVAGESPTLTPEIVEREEEVVE